MIYLGKAQDINREFSSHTQGYITIWLSKISRIMESKLTKYDDNYFYSPDTEIKVFSPSDDAAIKDSLKLA